MSTPTTMAALTTIERSDLSQLIPPATRVP